MQYAGSHVRKIAGGPLGSHTLWGMGSKAFVLDPDLETYYYGKLPSSAGAVRMTAIASLAERQCFKGYARTKPG